MSRSFEVKMIHEPEYLLEKAKALAIKEGVTFQGDTTSGRIFGKKIEGTYKINHSTLILTVEKKSRLLPWLIVEKKIRTFFADSDS